MGDIIQFRGKEKPKKKDNVAKDVLLVDLMDSMSRSLGFDAEELFDSIIDELGYDPFKSVDGKTVDGVTVTRMLDGSLDVKKDYTNLKPVKDKKKKGSKKK